MSPPMPACLRGRRPRRLRSEFQFTCTGFPLLYSYVEGREGGKILDERERLRARKRGEKTGR